MSSASPDEIQQVVEGAVTLFAVLGWVPAVIVAPVVLLGGGIAGLFSKEEKKKEIEENEDEGI